MSESAANNKTQNGKNTHVSPPKSLSPFSHSSDSGSETQEEVQPREKSKYQFYEESERSTVTSPGEVQLLYYLISLSKSDVRL